MARKIRGSTQIMDDSIPPGKISDQGHAGGLDSDTVDGKHAAELLAAPGGEGCLRADGSVPLTEDWDIGGHQIKWFLFQRADGDFPADPQEGMPCYRVDLQALYLYIASGWVLLSARRVWTTLVFPVPGTLSVLQDASLILPAPSDLYLYRGYVYVKTPPTGQAIIIDFTKDGTSIFADNPGNRPTILPGENVGISGPPDAEFVNVNQLFGIDVAQVGSGEPGADLTGQLRAWQEAF